MPSKLLPETRILDRFATVNGKSYRLLRGYAMREAAPNIGYDEDTVFLALAGRSRLLPPTWASTGGRLVAVTSTSPTTPASSATTCWAAPTPLPWPRTGRASSPHPGWSSSDRTPKRRGNRSAHAASIPAPALSRPGETRS